MFDYEGKIALVTGASAGLGEGFARALAARGADLVLVAAAFDALEGGKSYAVPGLRNYLMAQSPRLMPRSLIARVGERLLRPRRSRGRAATEGVATPQSAARH